MHCYRPLHLMTTDRDEVLQTAVKVLSEECGDLSTVLHRMHLGVGYELSSKPPQLCHGNVS